MIRIYFIIIVAVSFISLILFAYFRNRQAIRNDKRRERLWKKQEELMALLNAGKGKAEDKKSQ